MDNRPIDKGSLSAKPNDAATSALILSTADTFKLGVEEQNNSVCNQTSLLLSNYLTLSLLAVNFEDH